MTYSSVVNWLFDQVPNYQHQGGSAYKPGLERTQDLLTAVDNPEKKIKTIHIAGTNGKGSVSHILSAIFQYHGYKVGLFTSPHIKDFRERIKINGQPVSEDFVVSFYQNNKTRIEAIQPSFFEITTAMAFTAFAAHECDIAIIETGLGGRLDSTNVLLPELAVITNIGLDHVAFLGNTLEKIAAEKAGIIKPKVPVVIGDMNQELHDLFKEIAHERAAAITFSQDKPSSVVETDLLGRFQQDNIHTVLSAVDVLKDDWNLKEGKVMEALKNVAATTNFKGRLQKIGDEPLIVLDAAHNLEGIKNVLTEVTAFDYAHLYIVYGSSNDKNWQAVLNNFPKDATYYFTEFDSYRSVKRAAFEDLAKKNDLAFKTLSSPAEALRLCKSEARENDLILVCGSFYLMEEII